MSQTALRLRDGIPFQDEYDALLRSAAFRDMATFSKAFLKRNRGVLGNYIAKWGAENPLISWSRQWEYPYVFAQVTEVVRAHPHAHILDAGSGATFLPFYLRHCFGGTTVACCDADDTLTDVFSSLNRNMNGDIDFSAADIRALPYDNQSFDLVYCISVLEHTDSYGEILGELLRVSKRGRLAITFDISLDGTRDMRMENLDRLLKMLSVAFDKRPDLHATVMSQLSNPAIVTTHTVHPHLLPWRGPPLLHRLKSSLANRRLVGWPPVVTFCCLSGSRGPSSSHGSDGPEVRREQPSKAALSGEA